MFIWQMSAICIIYNATGTKFQNRASLKLSFFLNKFFWIKNYERCQCCFSFDPALYIIWKSTNSVDSALTSAKNTVYQSQKFSMEQRWTADFFWMQNVNFLPILLFFSNYFEIPLSRGIIFWFLSHIDRKERIKFQFFCSIFLQARKVIQHFFRMLKMSF